MNKAVPSTMRLPTERRTIVPPVVLYGPQTHRKAPGSSKTLRPFFHTLTHPSNSKHVLQMTLPKSRGKSNPSVRSFLSSTAKTKSFATYSSTAGSPDLKRTECTYLADGSSASKRQKVHKQADVPPTHAGDPSGGEDAQGCCNGRAHSNHKSQVSKSSKCGECSSVLM